MEQTIELRFDKTLVKLTGNRFGASIYETQVKQIINLDGNVLIVFPPAIDRIASSFIQGFFEEIMSQIGYSGVKDKIDFKSSIPNLKQFVLENLR